MKAFVGEVIGVLELLGLPGRNGKTFHKEPKEPVPTVTAIDPNLKAFLMAGAGNTNFNDAKPGNGVRYAEAPAHTVASDGGGRTPKAFIVDGQPTNYGKTMTIRDGHEPMMTVQSSQDKKPLRAYATGRVVKMTVQALGRFQTVPDTYKGLTTKINGNGVPCLMARGIMESFQ